MNNTLSTDEFLDLIATKLGVQKSECEKLNLHFTALIGEILTKENAVTIKGLGTFARKENDVESASFSVIFMPEDSLKQAVNKPFAHFEPVLLHETTVLEDTPVVTEKSKEGADAEEVVVVMDQVDNDTEEHNVPVDPIAMAEETQVIHTEQTVTDEPVRCEKAETMDVTVETCADAADVVDTVTETIETADVVTEADTNVVTDSEKVDAVAKEVLREEDLVDQVVENMNFPKQSGAAEGKKEVGFTVYVTLIISLVLIACGGVLYYVYYYDNQVTEQFTEQISHDLESAKKKVKEVQPVSNNEPQTEIKQIIAEKVTQKEEQITVKEEEPIITIPTTSKPEKTDAKPVKPDSVNYIIIGTQTTHILRSGETLTRVALKYYGTKDLWPYILMHNRNVIKNPNNVEVGTSLRIPVLKRK